MTTSTGTDTDLDTDLGVDVIDHLLGTTPGDRLDTVRRARRTARENAQRSYQALFEPAEPGEVTAAERYAVATFVAGLHGAADLAVYYAARLGPHDPGAVLGPAVRAEAGRGAARGPYGVYREPGLAAESAPGPVHRVGPEARAVLGERLAAALEHAHLLVLRPRESGPADLARLLAAGWSTTGVVTLSQLVAFLTFQVRVVHGLRVLAGAEESSGGPVAGTVEPSTYTVVGDPSTDRAAAGPSTDRAAVDPSTGRGAAAGPSTTAAVGDRTDAADPAPPVPDVRTYDDLDRPDRFTQDTLGWVPWLDPLPVAELTERHWAGLVDRGRADSPYFALLVRDPEVLQARTETDKDIFYNTAGGLPRAERELAATATSRLNGCVYCASVHARFASHHARRGEDVQRLLDDGVTADLGERWNAVVATAVALAGTPAGFGPGHVADLRGQGLDDLEIADLVHSSAFFAWANRLMLSLGEPEAAR
ncbi:alkylhydroperoxidase domain protein [Georgenia sp. TF02-10]|uniref:alkylhydroperoxidase domain protein n=1 Tax=Georgenia sp. TF02-10 TaxID=2917725 RepID=UPI001FA77E06|nr:alkylhydroperoxidase domain protein [Georgenia sp. TF02-10]UNX53810.1 alkylhydroperoxidase domain protein [Georgenia sp. TF02-10]